MGEVYIIEQGDGSIAQVGGLAQAELAACSCECAVEVGHIGAYVATHIGERQGQGALTAEAAAHLTALAEVERETAALIDGDGIV